MDFELKYCEKCIQMTNHLSEECQKCFKNRKFSLEDIENAYDTGSNFALKRRDDCFTDKFEEEKQKYIRSIPPLKNKV